MIQRSIQLGQASFKVLMADRELLLLPFISGLAAIITAAITVVPLTMLSETLPAAVLLIGFFAVYLVLSYITIFFSAALIHGVNERLAGGDPTISSAIKGAAARAGAILPWALVAATVSMVIRSIRNSDNIIASIVGSILAVAWASVTFLILPMIVIEGLSFKESASKAKATVRERWGDNAVAYVGIGFVSFLLSLPGVGLIFLGSQGGGAALVIAGFVLLLLAAAFSMALSAAYQAALYRFVTYGETSPQFFPAGALEGAYGS